MIATEADSWLSSSKKGIRPSRVFGPCRSYSSDLTRWAEFIGHCRRRSCRLEIQGDIFTRELHLDSVPMEKSPGKSSRCVETTALRRVLITIIEHGGLA